MSTDDRFAPDPTGRTSSATGSVRDQHGPIWGFLMHKVINPAMRRFLAGRFHAWMGSDTLMILDFVGKRTGRSYSLPIGYMKVDQTLFSYSPFGWWPNLEGGAPVSVVLRGQRFSGVADVSTDIEEVTSGLSAYLSHNPGDARFFHVSLDGERLPDPGDVARAAEKNVQIRIELD